MSQSINTPAGTSGPLQWFAFQVQRYPSHLESRGISLLFRHPLTHDFIGRAQIIILLSHSSLLSRCWNLLLFSGVKEHESSISPALPGYHELQSYSHEFPRELRMEHPVSQSIPVDGLHLMLQQNYVHRPNHSSWNEYDRQQGWIEQLMYPCSLGSHPPDVLAPQFVHWSEQTTITSTFPLMSHGLCYDFWTMVSSRWKFSTFSLDLFLSHLHYKL